MNNGLMAAEKMVVEKLYGVLPGDRPIIQNTKGIAHFELSPKRNRRELVAGVNVQPMKGGRLVKIQTLFTRKKPITD